MNEIKNINELISDLLKIPQHLLMHSHLFGLSDLLIGNLANKRYFNLKKAAYLLSNPEFDCTRGISGVEHQDLGDWDNLWDNPKEKIEHLQSSSFNQKIKKTNSQCLLRAPLEQDANHLIKYAEEELGFNHPSFISWDGRHGNHGIFFCESLENQELFAKKLHLLTSAATMLGMTHS